MNSSRGPGGGLQWRTGGILQWRRTQRRTAVEGGEWGGQGPHLLSGPWVPPGSGQGCQEGLKGRVGSWVQPFLSCLPGHGPCFPRNQVSSSTCLTCPPWEGRYWWGSWCQLTCQPKPQVSGRVGLTLTATTHLQAHPVQIPPPKVAPTAAWLLATPAAVSARGAGGGSWPGG